MDLPALGGRPATARRARALPELGAEAARQAAFAALHAIGEGRDPAEERRQAVAQGITLRDALEIHLRARTRSPRTEEDYREVPNRYLADWLNRPLREIGEDRRGVRERHERITQRHGRAVADYALRLLRAVYNRALREFPDLPPNPCRNVDYHGTRPRRVDLSPKRLRDWGRAVLRLRSPVRRDVHLFMLLSGMRRTATLEALAEHVDLAAGKLHVPSPKGGPERSFDLPLSGALSDLLRHRLAENEILAPGTPWIFPGVSSDTGHVAEVKEPTLGGLHGHALRHAYKTLCEDAGVSWAHSKLLLNHSVSDVAFGYMQRRLEALRGSQERASGYILAAVGLTWTPGEWPPIEETDE